MASEDRKDPQPSARPDTPKNAASQLQTILVPVDFSASSRKALNYALAFGNQFSAKLAVLHVVELPYVGAGLGEMEAPPMETELRSYAEEHLKRMVETELAGHIEYTTLLRTGQPWYEVTEAAKETDAHLIIMGTHGYTGLKHVLMGSTAERVVRHAPCPVLIVREREKEFVA